MGEEVVALFSAAVADCARRREGRKRDPSFNREGTV